MSPAQRPLPEVFLEKLRRILPPSHWDKALKSFQEPKPTTFRVNSLKSTPGEVKEQLESSGFKLGSVPWLKGAFILSKGRQRDLERTPAYGQGLLYVQNLSSMVPPVLLDPAPGEALLDLSAAPGSKTTQLAALMGARGSILANDNNPVRLEKLKANLERQGASNVEVLPAGDGGLLGKRYPERFDKVLLDAPCSSEGRFLASDPSSFGYWREDTNRRMAKDQRRLLKSALRSLKVGGLLCYSTCTFAPEENELMLQWALESYPGALEILPLSLPFANRMPGLTHWEGKALDPSVGGAARVLPDTLMEGFFVSLIRKKASLPEEKQEDRINK